MLDIWMDSAIRRRTSGASFPSALIIQASSPRMMAVADSWPSGESRTGAPSFLVFSRSLFPFSTICSSFSQADTEPGIVIPISRDQIRFGGRRYRNGLSACLILQNLDSDLAEDLLRRAESDFTNAFCQGRDSQSDSRRIRCIR